MLKARRHIYLFTIIPFIYFLVVSPIDYWDGTLFAFSQESSVTSGISYSFNNQGHQVQYVTQKFLIDLSSLLPISYYSLYRISLIIMLAVTLLLLRKIIVQVGINLNDLWVVDVIFLSSPFWIITLSSVMFIHVLCITIFLFISWRFSVTNKISVLMLTLYLFSLELNSLVLFGPFFFSYIAFLQGRLKTKYDWGKIGILATFSLTYYTFHNILLKPKGEFLGYNEIQIPKNFHDLIQILIMYLQYTTFIMPGLLGIFIILIINLSHNPGKLFTFKNFAMKRTFPEILLFTFSTAPYIAVGKSTSIRDIDWSLRHSTLLMISLPIIFSRLAFFVKKLKIDHDKIWLHLTVGILVLANVVSIIHSGRAIIKTRIEQNILIEELKVIDLSSVGSIFVYTDQIFPLSAREYDTNYLFYREFGYSTKLKVLRIGEPVIGFSNDWKSSEESTRSAMAAKNLVKKDLAFRPCSIFLKFKLGRLETLELYNFRISDKPVLACRPNLN